MQKPLFVIAIDVVNNIVYVGQGEDHPGLYRKAFVCVRAGYSLGKARFGFG